MATVSVRTRGQAPRGVGHRKITIKAGGLSLTLPITAPETHHSDLASDYKQVPRPFNRPLLLYAGDKLATFTQGVIFDSGNHAVEVETGIRRLQAIAQSTVPVTLGYGALEAGTWRVTDMKVSSVLRQLGSNRMLRAEVSLTFVRDFQDGFRPAGYRPPHVRVIQPSAKTYRWRSGDTLLKVAQRVYGHSSADWAYARLIGVYNHIRDARKVRVGTLLRIPPITEQT